MALTRDESEDMNRLNEYGVPLHACNGYCQDAHYWSWIRAGLDAWYRANPGATIIDYLLSQREQP